MTFRISLTTLALAAPLATGCSRFVWNEDPFTPDPAPATEILAAGRDTTYVLRGSSYYLLAAQRSALWNRDVMDDVAWRYRQLFGDAPSLIAVRIDSSGALAADSITTWRGVPLAVATAPRVRDRRAEGRGRDEREIRDSVAARILAGPMLAATAAEAWLAARASDAAGNTDSQPGGPSQPVVKAALPAWVEAGVLRLLASPGAGDRAAAELRANPTAVMPLPVLFAVRWRAKPNATDVVGIGRRESDYRDDVMLGVVESPRAARDGRSIPGVAPLFIAQSVSVLAFLRDRDPVLVGRLVDELTRGRIVSDVLATSTVLPRDLATLQTEWEKSVKRAARRR